MVSFFTTGEFFSPLVCSLLMEFDLLPALGASTKSQLGVKL